MVSKKIILAGIIVLIILIPNISALSIKINKEVSSYGSIYGRVFLTIGGFEEYASFADIEIEGVGSKKCGIQGGYRFSGLLLGRTYTITADYYGYKNSTKKVTLTKENPCEQRFFSLDQDPDERSKLSNINVKCFSQKIFGLVEILML